MQAQKDLKVGLGRERSQAGWCLHPEWPPIDKGYSIPTCRAGTASFSIDAPNGGLVTLTGNKLYQGSLSQNARMVDYGEEGLIFANNAFTVANTLFSSTKGSTIGIYDPHCVPVRLTGDTFVGVATQVSPAGCAVSCVASTQRSSRRPISRPIRQRCRNQDRFSSSARP